MKKFKFVLLILAVALTFVGCKKDDKTEDTSKKEVVEDTTTSEDQTTKEDEFEGTIHVVSREVGSGTRGAFTEITKILTKDADGNEVDNTYEEATIVNSTEGVITTVNGDINGIGYISLASLKDDVKALKVDGSEATPEKIKAGEYKISRPFVIAYKEDKLSDLAKDFIKFILSKDGQKIVEADGGISIDSDYEYEPANMEGTLTIAGSTSVTPVMEKMIDKYKEMNPGFKADLESNGSSAGIKAAIEEIADIGMSSRELKDDEKEQVTDTVIAMDGIAIVVNQENPTENITLEQVNSVFTGEITDWKSLK